MSIKITDTDKKNLYEKMRTELKALSELEGVAGILAKQGQKKKKEQKKKKKKNSDGKAGESTVLEVAFKHEFGSPDDNLPQRSFIRQAHAKGQAELEKMSKMLLIEIMQGKITAKEALELIASEQREYILDQFEQEGNPTWDDIQRDGTILHDTGQLVQSIHSQVRKKT